MMFSVVCGCLLLQNIMKLVLCSINGCVFRCLPDIQLNDSVNIFLIAMLQIWY